MSKELSRRKFLEILAGSALTGVAVGLGVVNTPGKDFRRPDHRELRPSIDLSLLPEHPPAAVVAQKDTVVAFNSTRFGNSVASGVKIDAFLALSALHVYGGENVNRVPNDMYLEGKFGTTDILQAAFPDPRNGVIPDLALMRTDDVYPYIELPNAQISSRNLQLGEPLFFMNYEPNSRGEIRLPNEPAVSRPELASPAFYGGITIGQDPEGRIVVATGLKNYNRKSPDKNTRPGSSGGPAFDQHGFLKGIVARLTTKSVSDLEEKLNISLTRSFGKKELELTYLEPVTEKIVNDMRTKLLLFL